MRNFTLPLLLLLTACAPGLGTTASPSATNSPPTFTPSPTLTPPASASLPILEIPIPQVEAVIYDFVLNMCNAKWTNNGQGVACPGNLEQISPGYIGLVDWPQIEGEMQVHSSALLTIPAQDGKFYGIFGEYPAFQVQSGDHFRAILACWEDYPCSVEYALEYFDAGGAYHILATWRHLFGAGPVSVDLDLSQLANQTVRFLLVVRDYGDPGNDYALWLGPHIWRDPYAYQVTPTIQPNTSDLPGVVSGTVDLSSAPPYLHDDPFTTPASVVVVALDTHSSIYRYFTTTSTQGYYYQMTVPPGDYYLVAYAVGVGGVDYVTGGYTGQVPSCGQTLEVVRIAPLAQVTNLVIADWNWTCAGTAFRPKKPSGVPIP